MSAINYARHRVTRRYVFLAEGDQPDPAWLELEWAWYRPPPGIERVLLIGEGPHDRCSRMGHAPGVCEQCRVRALSALARRDRVS